MKMPSGTYKLDFGELVRVSTIISQDQTIWYMLVHNFSNESKSDIQLKWTIELGEVR